MRHGLAQLVGLRLGEPGIQHSAPPEVARWFAGALASNADRNLVLLDHLSRIAGSFLRADIPFRVLKGAGLCITTYRHYSHRNLSDIDILVPEDGLQDAANQLRSLGFAAEDGIDAGRSLEQTFIAVADRDILSRTVALGFAGGPAEDVVARHSRNVVVELHRGLLRDATGRYRQVSLEAAWNQQEQAFLPDGSPISLLAQEALLAHLAAHALDHGFDRLIYFVDLAACLIRYGDSVDWELAARIASEWDAAHALHGMLRFVHDTFHLIPPERALSALNQFRARPITARHVLDMAHASIDQRTLARLSAGRGLGSRVAPIFRAVFPPKKVMERRYGKGLWRLAWAYSARPVELVLRVALAMARR